MGSTQDARSPHWGPLCPRASHVPYSEAVLHAVMVAVTASSLPPPVPPPPAEDHSAPASSPVFVMAMAYCQRQRSIADVKSRHDCSMLTFYWDNGLFVGGLVWYGSIATGTRFSTPLCRARAHDFTFKPTRVYVPAFLLWCQYLVLAAPSAERYTPY